MNTILWIFSISSISEDQERKSERNDVICLVPGKLLLLWSNKSVDKFLLLTNLLTWTMWLKVMKVKEKRVRTLELVSEVSM